MKSAAESTVAIGMTTSSMSTVIVMVTTTRPAIMVVIFMKNLALMATGISWYPLSFFVSRTNS